MPEIVTPLPQDIDGKKVYIIDVEGEEYQKKYKEGRYFKLNSSSCKGFRGIRKVGTCMGKLCMFKHPVPIPVDRGEKKLSPIQHHRQQKVLLFL